MNSPQPLCLYLRNSLPANFSDYLPQGKFGGYLYLRYE